MRGWRDTYQSLLRDLVTDYSLLVSYGLPFLGPPEASSLCPSPVCGNERTSEVREEMPSCNHSTCLRDVNTFLSLLPNCFLRTALGMFLIIGTRRGPANMWFIAQVTEDASLELLKMKLCWIYHRWDSFRCCTTGTAVYCTVNYWCHLFIV